MYTPDDLDDYYKRRGKRLSNPTPADEKNKAEFGDRWMDMIDVPLPVNKIPHPKIVKMRLDQELEREMLDQAKYEAHRRRWSKVNVICETCCECICLCLCACGKRAKGKGKVSVASATTD